MLVHSLPSKMWPALGRWHGEGAWGKYFDNPASGTDLELAEWQVIDLAGAAEHEDLCEAALFYLLERLRLALENPAETARVKLMVVDEAWRYLPRSGGAGLSGRGSQDLEEEERRPDYGDSKRRGRDRHRRSRRTARIHADPNSFSPTRSCRRRAADIFRLNPSEVATIRGLIPKRELYMRRPEAAGKLRLEVDPESYWLYTSSARDAQERAEAVERYGLEGALEHLSKQRR